MASVAEENPWRSIKIGHLLDPHRRLEVRLKGGSTLWAEVQDLQWGRNLGDATIVEWRDAPDDDEDTRLPTINQGIVPAREPEALEVSGLAKIVTERETRLPEVSEIDTFAETIHPGLQLNPKDAIGRAKVPFSTIPGPVLAEIALALGEGARKYGRHNWRKADIYASVYYDGALRHLVSWWEGEDIDPDSGVSHITKAIAGLIIARDAMMTGRMRDDRPPFTHDQSFMFDMNRAMGEIVDKYPNPVAPFTRQSS